MLNNSALNVRSFELTDLIFIVDYWINASDKALEKMGADPKKIPSEKQLTRDLTELYNTPRTQRLTDYLIWLVDEVPIGFSSLKKIIPAQSGEMHLHMWNTDSRGKGYGAILFCQSALEFYQCFDLQKIKCEPSASNPAPNKMLQKIGFPLVKTHTAASSELSLVCKLNEYDVSEKIVRCYLDQLKQ